MTYAQVADELVQEFSSSSSSSSSLSKQKQKQLVMEERNVRRRVYDTMNVLLAMGVVRRELESLEEPTDKDILLWVGLPTDVREEAREVEDREAMVRERVHTKQRLLASMVHRLHSHRQLAYLWSQTSSILPPSTSPVILGESVDLPFLLATTASNTEVQCDMQEDRKQVSLRFSQPFTLQDDTAALETIFDLNELRQHSSSSSSHGWLVPEYGHYQPLIEASTDLGSPDLRWLSQMPGTEHQETREPTRMEEEEEEEEEESV